MKQHPSSMASGTTGVAMAKSERTQAPSKRHCKATSLWSSLAVSCDISRHASHASPQLTQQVHSKTQTVNPSKMPFSQQNLDLFIKHHLPGPLYKALCSSSSPLTKRLKGPKADHSCTSCRRTASCGRTSCAAHVQRRSEWKERLQLWWFQD